ncbi:hypothetical protein [Oceanospirillum sediminis]|uniref:Uncharacterized protein n=1 Tax=Oceanospirillum sediminis TaxID=2760088 RepID=A0A839IT66_9GAMM|nr:hypothetical protein [Oceanospirillum sediminis]MBB1488653.1 hypothetical protein [Oceanospirillum sediminis]
MAKIILKAEDLTLEFFKDPDFKLSSIIPRDMYTENVSEEWYPDGAAYNLIEGELVCCAKHNYKFMGYPAAVMPEDDRAIDRHVYTLFNAVRRNERLSVFPDEVQVVTDGSTDSSEATEPDAPESVSIADAAKSLADRISEEAKNMSPADMEEAREQLLHLGKTIADSGIDLTESTGETTSEPYQQREKDVTPEKGALPSY